MSQQAQSCRYTYQTSEGSHQGHYLYWPSARPDAPLLVCVHGLTRNARDFDILAQSLTDHYRVICPDIAGRGDSERLRTPALYGYPLYVGQMQQCLQHLMLKYQVTEFDWVGTSMGGLIGMMLAAQPVCPLRKLVINDVGFFIPKASLERLSGYVGKGTDFADLAAVEVYLREVAATFGPLTDAQWQHLARYSVELSNGRYRLRYDPAIAQAFVGVTPEDVDLSAIWQLVQIETLLIRGGDSDLLLRETAQTMAAQAHVTLVEFPGIGHAPALMARDQIRAIRHFLGCR
ncbi:alpha/beta fold hydrolase [Oceanobacter sp. 4_MG-2023]|uniref:alpha/beta fold hydrolase n=1 Tax=Oceanobacter sp. 4_MG-2023 TaxID=3062623 RepID=UPI0027358CDA|nr:alpha/beta hydrolase [Oceanobacter sp. 4_MG-2023]MDP2547233.1 alpha/beta hydrolase [Oceanobacter sp. 4_MG-2023]